MQNTMGNEKREAWRESLESELHDVTDIITSLGYTLDESQPHVSGERYLQGGATKLVLNAQSAHGRAVIKASRTRTGIEEIRREKQGRDSLALFSFASDALKIPAELHFGMHGEYCILITQFIEQKEVLFKKPLADRFFMALRALEAQESFHATTYEHLIEVQKHLPIYDAQTYIDSITSFAIDASALPGAVELMQRVTSELEQHRELLERYNGYLAHFDFVPHNLRIDGHTIWILDFSELRFGSKYESWARLVNYMLIHDQPLAEALLSYVAHERGDDEATALHLMRIYKAALLVAFYARTLAKTDDTFRELTQLRVDLWMGITRKLLDHAPFPEADAPTYIAKRNALRSAEETERQKGFNLVQ